MGKYHFSAEPTPKGMSYGAIVDGGPVFDLYKFKVADRVLVRVTGIRLVDEHRVAAEFDYEWDRFTELFGCIIKKHSPSTLNGRAFLSEHEDGWRVTDVKLD
jgi:hypothetical protein